MKRVLVVVLSITSFSMVWACGSDSMGDEVSSTINPNPDVTVSIPSEEEMQAQLEKTEEFASTLIGLSEQEAITAIEGEGLIARVVARDGGVLRRHRGLFDFANQLGNRWRIGR